MRITEKKRVKIVKSCRDNQVFVAWTNTLGGREHWLFDTIQSEGLQTETIESFEPYTEDLESSRGQVIDLKIFAQPQITLYAQVDTEDLSGFESLIYSVNVEVLVNPNTWQTEGPKWQIYRPLPASFLIQNTDEVRTDFEITFNKAYINNTDR